MREPKDNEKYNALLKIDAVNGMDPEAARKRPVFEQLTPLFPEERLRLETDEHDTAARIMDLLCPIGKGQRGLIVSPPKAGKTTILKKLANSIAANNPEVDLFVLLVDERPEEVTDMQRSVIGEVVASTFDQPSENHVQVTELVLDRVKRLVEMGQRRRRAARLHHPHGARLQPQHAGQRPHPLGRRRLAPRCTRPRSSSARRATSRRAARSPSSPRRWSTPARAWTRSSSRSSRAPATWRSASTASWPTSASSRPSTSRLTGTRKEELLMEPAEAAAVWKLRGVLHALDPSAAIELLIKKIRETKTNAEFLSALQKNSR